MGSVRMLYVQHVISTTVIVGMNHAREQLVQANYQAKTCR